MEFTESNHPPASRWRKLFRKSTGPDTKAPVPVKPWTAKRTALRRSVIDSRTEWAKEIQSIDNDIRSRGADLPIPTLQAVANFHLAKDETLTETQWSMHLKSLIATTTAKHAAILSCAHLLERMDVRTLLLSILGEQYSKTAVLAFLDLLPLVQIANPMAVDHTELLWSASLKELILSTIGERARRLFTFSQLHNGTTLDPLLEPLARVMIPSLSALFLQDLHSSWENFQWINWGSRLQDLSDLGSSMPQTLTNLDPDWEGWAIWQPNASRLQIWNRLSHRDVVELKDLLELEGPDFQARSHSTFRHGLPDADSTRIETLIAGHEACDSIRVMEMLERFLSTLDQVVLMGPQALSSFKEVYSHRPIQLESLDALAMAAEVQSVGVFCALSQIVVVQNSSTQLTAAMEAVRLLSNNSHLVLREKMAPKIAHAIENNLALLQARLCDNISHQREPKAVVSRISDLARNLSGADWLLAHLHPEARLNIQQMPERAIIDTLFKLYERYSGLTSTSPSPLVDLLNEFILRRFGGRSYFPSGDRVIESLVAIWNAPVHRERRELSYAVATATSMPMAIRATCLRRILDTPEHLLTDALMIELQAIIGVASERNCLRLVRLIVTRPLPLNWSFGSWHRVLGWMLEEQGENLGSSIFAVDEWFLLVNDLTRIASMWEGRLPCDQILLQPGMLSWARELETHHLEALRRLQKHVVSGRGLQWVLRASSHYSMVIPCLEILDPSQEGTLSSVVESVLETLDSSGSNIASFCKTLALLKASSEEGGRLCQRLCQMCKSSDKGTAEYFTASWLGRSGLGAADKSAVRACAEALGLQLDMNSTAVLVHQDAAKAALIADFKLLTAQIETMDSIRRALQLHDTEKTSTLLQRIGVNFSGAAQGGANVPPSLVNLVERIGEDEFELFYPLTHLKPLQRSAMGISSARGLIIRVFLSNSTGDSAFCMHLHPDKNSNGGGHDTRYQTHQLWKVRRHSSDEDAPDGPICYGRPQRVHYQLSRTLHRYLATSGHTIDIDTLYNFMLARLGDQANCCVVCGRPCPALWRSTTCQSQCSLIWRRSSPQVHLLDLQADPLVVDLLLAMIYSAAKSGTETLLRGCPVRPTTKVEIAIKSIPDLSILQNAHDICADVKGLGRPSKQILAWATHSYRGFLTSATGNLKIPNMPGVTQFVLANQNPESQTVFSQSGSAGRVVFHGTSLDRLYPILCGGLKSLSGTALQRVGAALGSGIYLASEPSTSMNYATPFNNDRRGSYFSTLRILLGCELMGPDAQQSRSIYVVKDEKMVAVRYIFVFAQHTPEPKRCLIELPMQSAYASLRSGIA